MTYTTEELAVLGANIRRLREPRWKGTVFAQLVGISESHLSYIERGKRPAHPTVYRKIARLLGVTVAMLLENDRETAGAA